MEIIVLDRDHFHVIFETVLREKCIKYIKTIDMVTNYMLCKIQQLRLD